VTSKRRGLTPIDAASNRRKMESSSTPLRKPQKSTTQRLSEFQLLGGMPQSSADTERGGDSKEQRRLEKGDRGGHDSNTGRSAIEVEEEGGGER
jgi:hypothetical protein